MLNFILSLTLILINLLHLGSSSGLWKSLSYGCFSACSIVILLAGLKLSIFLSKSKPSLQHLPWKSLKPEWEAFFIESSNEPASVELIAAMSCAVGCPMHLITFSIWFKVDVPAKIGLPKITSPRMHPALHTSTAFVYSFDPKSISGARYQRVAT